MIILYLFGIKMEALTGILCAHVDDVLFECTEEFVDKVINPVGKSSLLDLNISQPLVILAQIFNS